MTADHASPRPLSLSQASYKRFAEYITRELGIKMPEAKAPMLQSRLQRRMRALGVDTLDEYQRRLFDSAEGDAEIAHFIDAVTTNKTDFFREPQHFRYLTDHVLPARAPRGGGSWRFKLWCAGCSSGEEPYTQAMVLSEYAREREGFDFSILATDISTRVLAAAQKAVYEESKIEPVPEALRKRYLLRSREQGKQLVRIVPALRAKARFQRLNFMDTDYGVRETFDAIFFRNVMIYFDKPTQEAVINKLCRNLAPGGYLFAGHSESLAGLDIPLKMVASAVYRMPL